MAKAGYSKDAIHRLKLVANKTRESKLSLAS